MRSDTQARRRHIRNLVTSSDITSQAAIREALASEGFEVTQATISRDLDAIGAVRVRNGGVTVYRLDAGTGTDAHRRSLHDAMDEFVLSSVTSGNLVVLKVPPGAAQFVASRIDASGIDGVLGTIAGDDTILVVADEIITASQVSRRLEGAE
jgi:transcriptional regulator of arginine metabolism